MNPYRGKRALDLLVAGSAGVLFAPAGHTRASGSTGSTCVDRVFPSICS
jgi:hypothetical protein